MAAEPAPDSPPSLADLLNEIVEDARRLFRQEVALARQEILDDVAHARAAAVRFSIGAAAAVLAGLFLLVAVAIGIADVLQWPLWAGFGIMGLLLGLIGLIQVLAGRRKAGEIKGMPTQTVESLKESVAWVKQRTGSGKR